MTMEPTSASRPRPTWWRRHWPELGLVLMVALVAVVRMRVQSLPLERDEGEYAYAGQLMLEGEPPYRLIYNMKLPGVYAAYAMIMALFGQSTEGIHLGFMLVNFGAVALLYFVGRRFLPPAGAAAAGAVYALMSLCPCVQGLNAHAEHFVALAALAGILVLLRAQERGGLAGFFWSGTLFGLAFLMKQPGGAFGFFGGSLMMWAALRRKPAAWKMDGLRMGLFAAGVAAPLGLTAWMLWRAGVWDKFWWWTMTYARTHATALDWRSGLGMLANTVSGFRWNWLFWALALAGLAALLLRRGRLDEKFFFLSLLFLSAAAICPTFHFTAHYFVLMLPVIALLAAKAFDEAAIWLAASPLFHVPQTSKSAVPQVSKPADRRQTWKSAAQQVWKPALRNIGWAPWILFGLTWAGVFWPYRNLFLLWRPERLADAIYGANNFQVFPVVAEYLRSHAPPEARLAVLGSEPELLFDAHRRSATGYIYMYDLVEEQPYRQRMEKEMISEVEQAGPDYVVFVNNRISWNPYPLSCFEEVKNWMIQYTDSHYEPCGVVTFQPSQYVWGPDCCERVPLNHRFVVIFHRKPAADPPKSAR